LNNDLRDITLPTTIITAQDDPIIPVADFYDLHTSDATRLIVQPYGGHNGFLEGWRLNGWYEQVMVDTFENAAISN
jgi:predicted alpha/beta-fold hydrolase